MTHYYCIKYDTIVGSIIMRVAKQNYKWVRRGVYCNKSNSECLKNVNEQYTIYPKVLILGSTVVGINIAE